MWMSFNMIIKKTSRPHTHLIGIDNPTEVHVYVCQGHSSRESSRINISLFWSWTHYMKWCIFQTPHNRTRIMWCSTQSLMARKFGLAYFCLTKKRIHFHAKCLNQNTWCDTNSIAVRNSWQATLSATQEDGTMYARFTFISVWSRTRL